MMFLLLSSIILSVIIFSLIINYHRSKYICNIIKNYNPSMIDMKDLFKINQFNGKSINGVFSTWGYKVMEETVYILSSNKLNILYEELTNKSTKVSVKFNIGISDENHTKFYKFDDCSLEILELFFNKVNSPVIILEVIIPVSSTKFYIATYNNIPKFLENEYVRQLVIFNAIDKFMAIDNSESTNNFTNNYIL